MSNAGISFGGLASGLDTRAIIAALMAVESRPINALATKKTSYQRGKDLFGNLSDRLGALRDKANALRTTAQFRAMTATVDNDQYLTATASNTATPSSHQIEVLSLARAQVNSSDGRADRDTTQYGDSVLQITVDGSTYDITVGGTSGFDSTLDGIAAAINAEGLDVVAEVIDTGAPTDPYQLVLRGRNTGTVGAFTVGVQSGPATMQNLIAEVDGNVRTAASNAQIRIDGITISRSSNTIADAIAGLTLNLKATTPLNTPVTVTVDTDAEATSQKVKELVDAYNAVVDFLHEQGQLDGEGKAKSVLFGDSTLRSIRSSLRSIVGTSVDTGNSAYSLFSQIGITSDTNGKLTFNQAKFEEALGSDQDAVAALFNKAGSGIAAQIYDRIELLDDSVDGILKARKDGFDSLIKQTQDRIDRAEQRLEQYEMQLEKKFANLESLLARLQSQGSSLSALNFGQSGR